MAVESAIKLNIAMRLRTNEVFRNEYFRTRSRNEIAAQLLFLRKKRRMTQKTLAAALKTQQSAVSRIEKADYASWNNQTLEQIAEVLHARWRHILEPVEDVIKQYEHEEMAGKTDTFETTYTGQAVECRTAGFVEPNETKVFTEITTLTMASASGTICYSQCPKRKMTW